MVDVRKHDEERVMQALKRAGESSEGSRAVATVYELANLVCDVRHETIAHCQARVGETLVFIANGAMTAERLRRLLAGAPVRSKGEEDRHDG